ncbi:MAG: SCP2 sterol-binding domain-containing protein, partial [Marmoricola sp.]
RATGRPGNLDSVGGQYVVGVFGRGLGFVLGKRARAEPGQTAAVELTDTPVRFVVTIDQAGRGAASDEDVPPDTTLQMSTESFIVLCGGRQPPETQEVTIEGDQDLGARFLAGLAVTP